jgi:hypothetical protein
MSEIKKESVSHFEMSKDTTRGNLQADMRTEVLLSPPKKFSKAAIQLYLFMILAYCSKKPPQNQSTDRRY